MKLFIVVIFIVLSVPVAAQAPAPHSPLASKNLQKSGQTSRDDKLVRDSVSLGDIEVSLGMSQDTLLGKLAQEGYKTSELGESTWSIFSKETGMWGNVGFTKGKLTYAIKAWGPQDQKKGTEFAAAVIGLLAHLEGEGEPLCIISTATTHEPTANVNQAFLYCGHKSVEIRVTRVERGDFRGEYAAIDETIRARPEGR